VIDTIFSPVVRWEKREQGQGRKLPPFRLGDVIHAVYPHLYHIAQQLVNLAMRQAGEE
jgi:hypothetical protein